MKRMWLCALGVCVGVAASATAAEAQMSMRAFRGYFTGQAGWMSGGDVTTTVLMPGAAISVQEDNGWGAEVDFGYAADVETGRQSLDVVTYMVNGNWIQPRGRIRPYVSAGGGVLQIDGCDVPCTRSAETFDLGLNGGGGVFVAFRDTVAVRGDVRYFRTLADHPELGRPENFSFWRVSLGVTFLWVSVP